MHHRKLLLVEGKDDSFAVSGLMDAHLTWGNNEREWPILIKVVGGVENLLADDVIPVYLKEPDVDHLGVVLDSDQDSSARWSRIRKLCADIDLILPDDLPGGALVVPTSMGKTFGFWMMPDNTSSGMLETFLTPLVPAPARTLWGYAISAVDQAKAKRAPFKALHSEKARLHTWLAWQDPPGMSYGTALLKKCLDPTCGVATPFVTWFRTLYGL